MTLTNAVTLPPASVVGGGVLGNAGTLPAGWENGVQFAGTEVCLVAGSHQFCPTSPTDKEFQGTDIAEFDAFGVEVSVVCTTLTSAEARIARAQSVLPTVAEFNVGTVLATGEINGVDTGNPDLADATDIGDAATAADGLAIIEGSIATNLRGHLAWVHVAPSTLTALVAADVVYLDDTGQWRTPTGHLVVASPGYETPLADLIVATTEVFAEVGAVEQVRMVDWTDNRHLAVHEAPALAVFDPCFNVSVDINTSP